MSHTLRLFAETDIDSLMRYANNRNIARYLTNQFPHPYTRESGEGFIQHARSREQSHIFAIDVDGEAVGAIGIHPQKDISSRNAELGYWLGEPFWGQGIITKAIAEVVDYGFANLDIDRIYARPFGSNLASQRTLEKNGFTLEARFANAFIKWETYEDELVYSIRKNENQ